MFAALAGLDHAGTAHLADEREAHVRQAREPVLPGLPLHLAYDVLKRIELVLIEAERLLHQRIALDKLGRSETHGNPRCLRVVLDQVRDAVDAAMQGAAIGSVGRAEVETTRTFAVTRDMHRVFHELPRPLVFGGGDGHDRNAQHALEQVDVDGAAVRGNLVHHVEGEHHGAIELHELHRKVEVALDVGGVDDVDEGVGLRL